MSKSKPTFTFDDWWNGLAGLNYYKWSPQTLARKAWLTALRFDPRESEPLPTIMGRTITRAEIIEGFTEVYADFVKLSQKEDPTFVRLPDYETILEFIEEHGLPPKATRT